jgi:cell division control protein 6
MHQLDTFRARQVTNEECARDRRCMTNISEAILKRMKAKQSKLFVLVLDEFDVIFNDEHASPSDFVYKLVTMHQELKDMGYLMTVISISNNVVVSDSFDDRIKSRIGKGVEIYFEPYTYEEMLEILRDRASRAFSDNVASVVIENIAKASWEEHGDVRRAIELLRLAGEQARA